MVFSLSLCGFAATGSAQLFSESFNTDTATAGVTYNPPFTFTSGGGGSTAQVAGGVLRLDNPSGSFTHTFARSGFAGEHRISTQVGKSDAGGSYNVGLTVGENNIAFHPGFAGGAFRVEGDGGFGNTNMGFTPAAGLLHQLDVDVFPSLGLYRMTLTDAANPANVFQRSFVNPDSVGGALGFRRSGGTTGDGRFDNLAVYGPGLGSPALTLSTVASHPFGVDTANTAAFNSTYSDFTTSTPTGGISTSGGVATLTTTANEFAFATRDGFAGELVVSALVGADNSNGNYNVGLQIGENAVVFHPGLAGGAFRVEGTGGFGNQNIGFTPANDTLHELIVHAFDDGLFEVTLIDGDDDQNIYHAMFTNPNWATFSDIQRQIGFRVGGPNAVGFFQDLTVQQFGTVVPEPTSIAGWLFVGAALIGFGWRRNKRKR